VTFVDDTLLWSPKQEWIDEVIDQLKTKCQLDLEKEEDVAGFLGVHIERTDQNNTIKLTQSGLAERICEALHVGSLLGSVDTPAVPELCHKDENGPPAEGLFNYASVIGMLQYLQGHSRPDICYAVSQCSRFTHSPKQSHEKALQCIGCYLKGTMKDGLILKPTNNFDIDCYIDADFAGLWNYESPLDPACVKSRAGFAICISNCPVIWQSKLIPFIALSTMEAEYSALSMAMRELLPFRTLFTAVASAIGISSDITTNINTVIHEDNSGALTLANLEPGRVTPRSKQHYAIRLHWFRQFINEKTKVVAIATKDQKADILTKGLRSTNFKDNRLSLCGW
jgi:hypothetical protein